MSLLSAYNNFGSIPMNLNANEGNTFSPIFMVTFVIWSARILVDHYTLGVISRINMVGINRNTILTGCST